MNGVDRWDVIGTIVLVLLFTAACCHVAGCP